MSNLLFLIIFLVGLILASGVLSGSETALFSLSSMKVKAFKQSQDPRGKQIANLLSKPRDLLVTILMLNVMVNILVQNVVAGIFGTISLWIINVGVPLFLTLIFGEVIPKSLALTNNAKVAYQVAPSLVFINKLLSPIRILITKFTSLISHYLFYFLKREKEISVGELKLALKTSREYGILNPEETKLIRGYLNLEEDLVKELMQPRHKILYYDINSHLEKLVQIFVDEEVTRVPICDKDLQHVYGILSSLDFFLHKEKFQEGKDVLPFVQKPFFVPENSLARELREQMYTQDIIMALVVDEYGSTSGLITLEDISEMVIGQISDRRDERSLYTRAGEDVVIASGKLELSQFEEIFDVHLESPGNMATIAGYLTEKMGEIPKSGSKWVSDDFLFHILSSDEKRIKRVYIRRLHPKGGL